MLLRTAVSLLLFAAHAAAANLPYKVNFQGKLLDSSGSPIDGPVQLILRLYNDPSTPVGSAPYIETQNNVPVSNGVFSIQIGSAATLTPDLFTGASVYLGVQVNADSEMSPRQELVMSAYAFTAAQLSADQQARVRVGNAYSTFTVTGHLLLSAGIAASSGSFVNGVTAASGTFTASGATQYSVRTSSGALIGGGTLRVDGSGGLSALYGAQAATVTASQYFQSNAPGSAPAVGPAASARVYYDGTKEELLISANGRDYTPLGSMSTTLWNTNAVAVAVNQGSNLPAALTEFDSAVQGTRMMIDCNALPALLGLRYNFRSSAATALTIVMSVRDVANTANTLATASQAVNAAQTWVGQGTLAAKPAWCTGTQTVAVYTSGGNGGADFIFKHIILVGKP